MTVLKTRFPLDFISTALPFYTEHFFKPFKAGQWYLLNGYLLYLWHFHQPTDELCASYLMNDW